MKCEYYNKEMRTFENAKLYARSVFRRILRDAAEARKMGKRYKYPFTYLRIYKCPYCGTHHLTRDLPRGVSKTFNSHVVRITDFTR